MTPYTLSPRESFGRIESKPICYTLEAVQCHSVQACVIARQCANWRGNPFFQRMLTDPHVAALLVMIIFLYLNDIGRY